MLYPHFPNARKTQDSTHIEPLANQKQTTYEPRSQNNPPKHALLSKFAQNPCVSTPTNRRVPQVRGPRGQVSVRGVEIPRIWGPGKARSQNPKPAFLSPAPLSAP